MKDRGLEKVTQVGIAIGIGLDGNALDGELQIRGGKSEGESGIVAIWEGLVELVGQCIEKGGVRSRTNGGVDEAERDSTVVVNKNLKANWETRIGFH